MSQPSRLKDSPYKGPEVQKLYGPVDGPFKRVFGEAFIGKEEEQRAYPAPTRL